MTKNSEPLGRADVEVVEHTTPYRDFFWIDKFRLRHRRFDGSWTPVFEREIFRRADAVALLPYDPVRDRIILVEQFRAAAYASGRHPWTFEVVAGIIDRDETPEAIARREAVEEAGREVRGDLVHICDFFVSPGGATEFVKLYCGRVDAGGDGGLHGLVEEHEDIRAHVLDFEDAYARVRANQIPNAVTIISVLWLALNREDLRRRWR